LGRAARGEGIACDGHGLKRASFSNVTQPVSFSDNLVPASKLNLPSVTTGNMGLYSRGVRTYHTWIETAPTALTFKMSAGLIYGNRGEAKIALFPKAEEEGKAVAEAAVAADKPVEDQPDTELGLQAEDAYLGFFD
jgi:hypothetical protein